jgi:hypothetical protein
MTAPISATPPPEQSVTWFEMPDVRRRRFDSAVWIPLRAIQTIETRGRYGFEGHCEHFFGAATLALPLDQRAAAEKLGWDEVGIGHDHRPDVEGQYVPVDIEGHQHVGVTGVRLVFEQRGNREESRQWHLNADLAIALGLKREGDEWLAIDEGYATVARLTSVDDSPVLLEIRAEYLKDYLCARGMALLVSSFRERRVIVPDASWAAWPEGRKADNAHMELWEAGLRDSRGGYRIRGADRGVPRCPYRC